MRHETSRFPAPQADSLDTIVAAVIAVDAGCGTARAASEAIGLVERQGAYYLNAAGTFGWLEKDTGSSPTTWHATPDGAALAAATPIEQADIVVTALLSNPYAAGYDPAGHGNALEAHLCHDGLEEETAQRRVQTLRSWWNVAGLDPKDLAERLARENVDVARRLPDALATASRQYATMHPRAKATVYGAICPTCHVTMPLSGICPDC